MSAQLSPLPQSLPPGEGRLVDVSNVWCIELCLIRSAFALNDLRSEVIVVEVSITKSLKVEGTPGGGQSAGWTH